MKYFYNKLKLLLSFFICLNFFGRVPGILSSTCPTGLPALSLKDCTSITNSVNYCCLLKMFDGTPVMCYGFDVTKFTGQSTVNYGANTYFLDCGINYTPSNLSNTTNTTNTTIVDNTNSSIINNNSTNTTTFTNNTDKTTPYTDPFYYGVGLSNCGRSNPIHQWDCNIQSTKKNSCCFYSVNGVNGCYWIDRQFYWTYQTDTFDLICDQNNSYRISISFSLIKIIILILIF